MIKLLFPFLKKYLPYIIFTGVCIYFIHSYTSLQHNNRILTEEVRSTQVELQHIKDSYAKQQELIILQQKVAKDLEDFREESHRRTIDFLHTTKEIGHEIKNDPISVLHPDVVRMLNEYTSEHNNP